MAGGFIAALGASTTKMSLPCNDALIERRLRQRLAMRAKTYGPGWAITRDDSSKQAVMKTGYCSMQPSSSTVRALSATTHACDSSAVKADRHPKVRINSTKRTCMSTKAAHHHKQAAEHYNNAAKHHTEAAKHHESGNHEKAAPRHLRSPLILPSGPEGGTAASSPACHQIDNSAQCTER